MNNALPKAPSEVRLPEPGASRRPERMLAELLALNEEMAAQLQLECMEAPGTADFLTGMIRDHERAAVSLSGRLSGRRSDSEASPPRHAPPLVLRLAHSCQGHSPKTSP